MATLGAILVFTFLWGSIYLLISIGFSLICGVLRIFHLGYGVAFVLAAYLVWVFMNELHLDLIPSLVLMFVIQVGIAILVFYKGIFERYLEEEEILLALTVLVSLVVSHLSNYFYPITAGVSIPTTVVPGAVLIGSVSVPCQMLVAAGLGVVVAAGFVVLFLTTKVGLVMRAMSQNLRAARLMGADVSRMYYVAMALSVVPPTIAMLAIAPFWGIDPFAGVPLFMTAIVISVIGGLGNLKGSIVASYLIGFVHVSISFLYISRFMGIAGLLVALIVLIGRRGGIFAEERLW